MPLVAVDLNSLQKIKSITLDNENIELNIRDVKFDNGILVIDLQSISSKPLTHDEYLTIRENIEKKLGEKIILEVSPKIVVR